MDGLREGARDVVPVVVAVVPFGLVAGVAAVEAGFPTPQAVAMSYLVFAGSAQLAAVQLLAQGAPGAVILVTTLLLNLRFALYSAAFAPHLRSPPWPARALLAALMTDQAMAITSQRFGRHPGRGAKVAYYLGVAFPIGLAWTTASTVGVLAGKGLPVGWSLDFVVPLVFLTLWVVVLRAGRAPVWIAGAVAAVAAVVARPLPYNLGLLVAAFAGIAAGTWWEARRSPEPRPGGRTIVVPGPGEGGRQ